MKTLYGIFTKILLPCLAVAGAAYAIFYSLSQQNLVPAGVPMASESVTQVASPTGAVKAILAGPGIVEPAGRNVEVAPPLPGLVESVIGQDRVGQLVKKGEELLKLDSKQLQAELAVREAQLASATAALNKLKNMPRAEDLAPLVANAQKADVAVKLSEADYGRAVKAGSALSTQEVDEKKYALESAKAQYKFAVGEYNKVKAGAWEPDILVAEASVTMAESQVAQVKADLNRLTVHCQSDLTLLSVDVRPQEYVGIPPGEAIILLGDTKNLNVRVYIDEHDASRYNPGAKATASLPQGEKTLKFPLVYVRHEPVIVPKPILTGEQTERVDVRVLQTIYRFENEADQNKVLVGQQLDVYFDEQ